MELSAFYDIVRRRWRIVGGVILAAGAVQVVLGLSRRERWNIEAKLALATPKVPAACEALNLAPPGR